MEGFKHILVDGWNAIHAHPKLAHMLRDGMPDEAQTELASLFEPLHDFDGARITIVYDGVGDDISIVRRGTALTFSEVYTPSAMTADEFIEQFCATSKRPSELLVITRDNLLRLTASSFGAMSVPPESFFGRAERSRRAIGEWKKSGAFARLDELALDIESAFSKTPLMSKHLKKKICHAQRKSDGGADGNGAKPEKAKPARAAAKPAAPVFANQSKRAKKMQPLKRPIIGGKPAGAKALSDLKKFFEKRG